MQDRLLAHLEEGSQVGHLGLAPVAEFDELAHAADDTHGAEGSICQPISFSVG
jgi:hypothetical protein